MCDHCLLKRKNPRKTSFWHLLKVKKFPKLWIGGRGNLSNAQKREFFPLPFHFRQPYHLSFIWQISGVKVFDGIKKKTYILRARHVILIFKTKLPWTTTQTISNSWILRLLRRWLTWHGLSRGDDVKVCLPRANCPTPSGLWSSVCRSARL